MIYVFLAEGFEEIEALSPVDVLRRAGLSVKTVGIGSKTVLGSHNIPITADITENEATFDNLQAIILPGGMPGTLNLEKSEVVQKFIDYANNNSLLIGAICAAPSILGHKMILKGKKATCFPGFEKDLYEAMPQDAPFVRDGNIITARSAGSALDFAFALLSYLKDDNTANRFKDQLIYK